MVRLRKKREESADGASTNATGAREKESVNANHNRNE
jgi:hypothetical protein